MREVSTGMNCQKIKSSLPDLLLDPSALSAEQSALMGVHLAACPACREELAGLRSTMRVLDSWAAPEPSPYFATRMQAKLRAEKEAAPEGFWERLRARLLFGTNVPLRAAGAAALAVVLFVGGGSALFEIQNTSHAPQTQASATINDLQSLDGNAQVFQQLNALDADDADPGSASN